MKNVLLNLPLLQNQLVFNVPSKKFRYAEFEFLMNTNEKHCLLHENNVKSLKSFNLKSTMA